MLIEQIYRLCGFATDKGITGYHSPEEVMNEVHAVQMDLFNDFREAWAQTQHISDFLAPFLIEPEEVTLSSGKGTMSTEMEHPGLAVSALGKNAEIVALAEWAYLINDPISPPSASNVKVLFKRRINNKFEIEVRPTTETKITIHGLRVPKKPVYGFTIESGRMVFSEQGSTDVEFSELLHNRIRDNVLVRLGINLREFNIAQAAAQLSSR